MLRIFILFILITGISACSIPTKNNSTSLTLEPNQPYSTIWLVTHGWHAGIVLQTTDVIDTNWAVLNDFPNVNHLEIGWGDKEFYQTPDAHLGIILRAALLPTASVLHIAGFKKPVTEFFPYTEIIKIKLPKYNFTQLLNSLKESFYKDEDGNLTIVGEGLYGNGLFYLSQEKYHLFNTCNVWVARKLKSAGLPINPSTAITVGSLMSQARTFGTVIQQASEDR